jgi:hypothetical protein
LILVFASAVALWAADPLATTVTRRLDAIERGKTKPGEVIRFTPAELNAWVRIKAPTIVHAGFRDPELRLGNGTARASALIDFLKVRQAEGIDTNWLVAKLIQGEKLVTADASIESSHGKATVHLIRVEVGGVAVMGPALQFMVEHFFRPFYPDAKIDEPFELADGVDRIVATPAAALVYMRR